MRLQGNIDAAVNGGVAKYVAAFFNSDFGGSPSEYNLVECLAGHVETLSKLLSEGLELHGQLATDDLQPLHEWLVDRYSENREGMQKSNLMLNVGRPRVASIVNTPLPPLPRIVSDDHLEVGGENNLDNCYHEVVIGEAGDCFRAAPPLPPRGVKSSNSFSLPGTGESYVKLPPALPHRLSSLHLSSPASPGSPASPPPLMRKHSGQISLQSPSPINLLHTGRKTQPPPVPPKSISNSETGSDG